MKLLHIESASYIQYSFRQRLTTDKMAERGKLLITNKYVIKLRDFECNQPLKVIWFILETFSILNELLEC